MGVSVAECAIRRALIAARASLSMDTARVIAGLRLVASHARGLRNAGRMRILFVRFVAGATRQLRVSAFRQRLLLIVARGAIRSRRTTHAEDQPHQRKTEA